MRYPASEKLEIIHLVEQSSLPIKQTLNKLGIPRTTFYRWYDRYQTGGPEALEDQSPRSSRVWNRIPDDVRQRIVDLALDVPELSPRELAIRFTDAEKYFVSEASVYRLLKSLDLITSPAFIVIKAANEFKDKTTAINQLWQTDFTYLKVIGWGWMYLSSILDDFLPGDLEQQIELFVDHYNHQGYHESLKNLTPADIYYGCRQSTIAKREKIKRNTIAKRRLHYQRHAA